MMVHTVHYPREIMVDRVVFTPADHDRIARCRGPHNRLGFAYTYCMSRRNLRGGIY